MEYSCIHNHQSQFLEMTRTADRHPIGQLCDIFGGATPARTNKEYWENGTCPWFTVEDLHNQGAHIWKTEQHITEAALKKVKKYPVDTVLLCCTSATIGSVAYSHIPLSSNQQFNGLVVKDRNKLRPEFLFYNCTLLKDELLKQCGKTTFAFVPRGTLEKIEIFCPDIHVQNQFVKVLEQADKSKFDGFKSQFLEWFGGDKFVSTTLPEISENLDYKRVPITSGDRNVGQFPYYGASGIVDYIDNYIFDEPLLLVSEDGANLKDRVTPIAFIAEGKYWVNNHAHVLKFTNFANMAYICHFFNFTNIEKYLTGMAQPKLNQAQLNTIKIPWPPVKMQEQFAALVEQADKSKYYEIN